MIFPLSGGTDSVLPNLLVTNPEPTGGPEEGNHLYEWTAFFQVSRQSCRFTFRKYLLIGYGLGGGGRSGGREVGVGKLLRSFDAGPGGTWSLRFKKQYLRNYFKLV